MKRDHTVYILGAGFSAKAGVPIVRDFLDRVRRNYEDPTAPPLPAALEPHYQNVLKYRFDIARVRDYVSLELDNIEVLFSLLEMDALLGTGRSDLATSMRHVICHTVAADINAPDVPRVRVNVNPNHRERLLGVPGIASLEALPSVQGGALYLEMSLYAYALAIILGDFGDGSRSIQSTIITLNYDTLVEQAAWQLHRAVDYGAKRFRAKGKSARIGSDSTSVRLLKLHGSSNWAHAGVRNVRADVYDQYADFGAAQMPLIIPPTWRKGATSPAYTEIWKAAGKALENATSIVVIGYSLPSTDQHIRHLLTTALSRNPGVHAMHVVDVEHDPDAISRRRYKRLFGPLDRYGRLTFDGSGAENYFRGLRSSAVLAPAIASLS